MNRNVRNVLIVGTAWAGSIATLASRPAAAADDAVVTADKAVVAALAKGDKVAANKWLDPDFTWIDSEGIMWAKTDAFRAGLKPLVAVGTDTKIIEHKYGKSVVWIQWNQGNKYSARFWVKRPTGWKLLHTTEIATMPKRDFQPWKLPSTSPATTPARRCRTSRCHPVRRRLSTSGRNKSQASKIGRSMLPTTWTSESSARTAGPHLPRRIES